MELSYYASVEEIIAATERPSAILINMNSEGLRCPSLLLLNVLRNMPDIPVICYPSGDWVFQKIFRSYANRIINLSYEDLLLQLRAFVDSDSSGVDACNSSKRILPGNTDEHLVISKIETLSPRERDTLCLIGKGHGIPEIADCLGMADETVKTHLKGIRHKTKQNGMVPIRQLAHEYARTGVCRVFIKKSTHTCSCAQSTVGNCPVKASSC